MGVVGRVDFVAEAEVGQVVDIDPVPQGHRNGIPPQLDAENNLTKTQLPNSLLHMIVPNENPMRRCVGIDSTTSHQRNQIATKQHLNRTNATVQTPMHRSLKWMEIQQRKTLRCPQSEATPVLIKGTRQQLGLFLLLNRVAFTVVQLCFVTHYLVLF